MDITILLIAALVLLVALVVVLVVFSRRLAVSEQQGKALELQNAELEQQRESLMQQKSELEVAKATLEERLCAQKESYEALKTQDEQAQKRLNEEREATLASQRKQLEESFRLLSEQNSEALRRKNNESIEELLKPIKEKFGELGKSVQDSSVNAAKQEARMSEMIKHLMEQSKTVGDEARNLANALKGRSKMQGDFGEMLLVDLLKSAGMEEGVHFATQGVMRDANGHEIKSDDGKTMIPDVIVYYPDDTEVIVDSKVSLKAFVAYYEAQTVEERNRYAREHVESVRKHVDELKTKNYASYIAEGKKKLDYNIMFIPIESAFNLMLEEEPLLWQQAKDAKVLIVSQMTLMIVLNMVLMTWKQHDQERNIAEVYKTASELMSQLKSWLESYVEVGNLLQKVDKSYQESKKKLVDSNQSVIKKIDKLEKLGLSPKRSNARLKPGTRMVRGAESVIPMDLSEGLECDEEMQIN